MKHSIPTLIGKKAHQAPVRSRSSLGFKASWILFLAGPLTVLGSWAYLGLQPITQPVTVRTVSSAQTTRTLLSGNPVPPPTSTAPVVKTADQYCTVVFIKVYYDPKLLFPLLPPGILGDTTAGVVSAPVPLIAPLPYTNSFFNDSVVTSTNVAVPEPECSPAYWNKNILTLIAWKALSLMYWIASVLAVIITIYAGLLFISGFASEENTKTAKKLLVACYTGVVIIILGRIILYGVIQPFLGKDINATNIGIPPGLLK